MLDTTDKIVQFTNVRDYYTFRELYKFPFIYFGYCDGVVLVAANKYLLDVLGY